MVLVQIHKIVIEKRHPPSPPGPMLVWKVKCKLDLVQMIINIDLGEGGVGGFQFTKINSMSGLTAPVVPMILRPTTIIECKINITHALLYIRSSSSGSSPFSLYYCAISASYYINFRIHFYGKAI